MADLKHPVYFCIWKKPDGSFGALAASNKEAAEEVGADLQANGVKFCIAKQETPLA